MSTFYTRTKTRTRFARNKGTVSQAIAYIGDDHDTKRITNVSEDGIKYIVRIDPNFKQNHEGGRVPLHGHGVLAEAKATTDNKDIRKMKAVIEYYCSTKYQPNKYGVPRPTRGIDGYQEHTLTIPKELSLIALTDKERMRTAVAAAVTEALEEVYAGKQYAGVSAMHMMNKAAEPHNHVHVIVGKWMLRKQDQKWGSVNSASFYDDGIAKDGIKIKHAWTRAIHKHMQIAFGIKISFQKMGDKHECHVETKDHVPLKPLTRATLREKQKAYREACAPKVKRGNKGHEVPFDININDARILEVAARAPLNRENFETVFPDHPGGWERAEKRARRLQEVGLLDERLRPTKQFRDYAEVMFTCRAEYAAIKEDCDKFILEMAKAMQARVPDGTTVPTTMPMVPSIVEPNEMAKNEKEKEKDDDTERKTEQQAAHQPMQQAQPRHEDLGKRARKRLRKELAKAETAKRMLTNPMSIDDAVHKRPLEFAKLNEELDNRLKRLGTTQEQTMKLNADWTDRRREATPELRKWAEVEQKRWNHIAESEEKMRMMTPTRLAVFKANNMITRDEYQRKATEEHKKAALSLLRKERPENEVIMDDIRKDREMLHSMQNRIRRLIDDKKDAMQWAEPCDKNYIAKYYETRIRDLKGIARKIKTELDEKRSRAFEIEMSIPVSTALPHWNPAQPETMEQDDARAKTEAQILRGLRVMWLKEGVDADLQAVFEGWSIGITLRKIANGTCGEATKDLYVNALRMGEIMQTVESRLANSKQWLPPQLKTMELERKMTLMLTRCKVMQVPVPPDLFKATPKQMEAALEKNPALKRLAQEGSEFMVDWNHKTNYPYVAALFAVVKEVVQTQKASKTGPEVEPEEIDLHRHLHATTLPTVKNGGLSM